MGQINIGGTSASVQLQGNNTITSDQTFTFPDTGGELATNASGGGQVVGYQHGTYAGSYSAGTHFWVQDGTKLLADYCYFGYWRVGQIVTINVLLRATGSAPVGEAGSEPRITLPYNTKKNDSGGPFVAWPGVQVWFYLNEFNSDNVQFFSYAYTGGAGVGYIRPAYRGGSQGGLAYLTAKNIKSSTQTNIQFTYETDDTTWIPNS